jgi:hypothetical protein
LARFRIIGSLYVVLEGSDGEELLRTPPLRDALACRAAILAIRLNALLDQAYARADVAPRGFCFVLHSVEGNALAVSPVFRTELAREKAIEAVQRGASDAYVTHAPPDVMDLEPPMPITDAAANETKPRDGPDD